MRATHRSHAPNERPAPALGHCVERLKVDLTSSLERHQAVTQAHQEAGQLHVCVDVQSTGQGSN